MPLILRFVVPVGVIIGLMAYGLVPLVEHVTERWARRDIEMRSTLVYNAMADRVSDLAAVNDRAALKSLFNAVAQDERLLAIGLCMPDGTWAAASTQMPIDQGCANARDYASAGEMVASEFPVARGNKAIGRLVLLHGTGFIDQRAGEARLWLVGFMAILALAIALVTIGVARLTARDWVRSVRAGLRLAHGGDGASAGGATPKAEGDVGPVVQELRQMLRELDISRRTSEDIKVTWSPNALRFILQNELPGAEVIVVSNREPYIHNLVDGQITLQVPASGLVAALEPITRACGGTWVAHGSGTGDRDTVDQDDRLRVPPARPAYTLRRVWLSEEEQQGYYYGFANEGLWPLCHIVFMRPIFRTSDWETYKAVNQKFADTVVAEARGKKPIILLQDYHFALVPRMIRRKLPDATIITFWHIPWPNSETFGICPWRDEILDGMLGSSILGFHTQFHCNNFFETVDRFLESRIEREHASISYGGESTLVRRYPISIEWPPAALEAQPPVAECRRAVFAQFGLGPDLKLGVGVERFDYTKGIVDRLRAVQELFERHPHWIGRFVFLQVAAPTRSTLAAYRLLRQETEDCANELNQRYGRDGYRPIILLTEHHDPDDVYRLFRAADVCVVSSLHDGMNLVAKEFVAAREDEAGVLMLSTFAGASQELLEALIVNPYDATGMATALRRALTMPLAEQAERMRYMRQIVRDNNVYRWAGSMLIDAARLRKRSLISGGLRVAAGPRAAAG